MKQVKVKISGKSLKTGQETEQILTVFSMAEARKRAFFVFDNSQEISVQKVEDNDNPFIGKLD